MCDYYDDDDDDVKIALNFPFNNKYYLSDECATSSYVCCIDHLCFTIYALCTPTTSKQFSFQLLLLYTVHYTMPIRMTDDVISCPAID